LEEKNSQIFLLFLTLPTEKKKRTNRFQGIYALSAALWNVLTSRDRASGVRISIHIVYIYTHTRLEIVQSNSMRHKKKKKRKKERESSLVSSTHQTPGAIQEGKKKKKDKYYKMYNVCFVF
jgi:hypothetical protein